MAVTVAASSLKEALELLKDDIASCCDCGTCGCCVKCYCGFNSSAGQTSGSGSLSTSGPVSIGCEPCIIPAGIYASEPFFTIINTDTCVVSSSGGFIVTSEYNCCRYEFDFFFYRDCPPATAGTSKQLLMDLSVRVSKVTDCEVDLLCADLIEVSGVPATGVVCNGDGTMTFSGTYGGITVSATIGWV